MWIYQNRSFQFKDYLKANLKIIDQHIKHCVRQAFTEGEVAGNQKVDEIIYLIDKYVK